MKTMLLKYIRLILTICLGLCAFFFWYCAYPQALCYQEQNQLFLWTFDYFSHDMRVAGGLADYVSEFLVQFYYVPFWGAGILACLFMAFYVGTCRVLQTFVRTPFKSYWSVICLLPVLLLWARKGSQLLDIRGNLSVIVLQKLLTAGNDILRLIMIKACRVNILLQLCKICLCKVLDRSVFLE